MLRRLWAPWVVLGGLLAALPAAAEVGFEPLSWFSSAVRNRLTLNQYAVGMGCFALSPHDPPQLFVGFENLKHPEHRMHGVLHCWVDGSRLRVLVADEDEPTVEAQWSPDGRYVAYLTTQWAEAGTRVRSSHLWIMDVVTEDRWCVSRGYATGLRWLPGSDGLLFWRYPNPDGDEPVDWQHIAPQASRVTAPWATPQTQALSVPALRGGVFSPDARQVAYWGHLPGKGAPNRVLVADVATGQVRSLQDEPALRPFQGPAGVDQLTWSPDSQKLFLQVYSVVVESTRRRQFVIDAATGTFRALPEGLGTYLQPVLRDLPGRPPVKRLPQPKEARWAGASWMPGTHKLLCVLWDPFGEDAWTMMAAGGLGPQYAAWVVVDTDTGQVEPVTGLPVQKAVGGPWGGGFGLGAGAIRWSGRYLHLENDYMNLYRMK